jgi:hypothetical protein
MPSNIHPFFKYILYIYILGLVTVGVGSDLHLTLVNTLLTTA